MCYNVIARTGIAILSNAHSLDYWHPANLLMRVSKMKPFIKAIHQCKKHQASLSKEKYLTGLEYFKINKVEIKRAAMDRENARKRAKTALKPKKHTNAPLTKRLRQQFKDFKKKHKLNGGHRIHNQHYLHMMSQQDHKCVICRTDIDDICHIDHIYPVSLGGSNTLDNLQLLCPECNMGKGNLILPSFFPNRLTM